MTRSLNRRHLIAGLAATGTLAGCASRPALSARGSVFAHGVASGDPDTSSVVLWTRISSVRGRVPVRWEVAADPAFAEILLTGNTEAGATADHTVKVVASPLPAGRPLYYRFMAAGETSPVGRTRIFAANGETRIGIALASCSNYAFGYFNAYDAIARDPDVHLVLHTGDYIYEYGAGEWGDETARVLGRRHVPSRETVTLADYRQRHAQYKSDAGAQAMHAAHPFVACWDDHEVTNNPWTDGAENHQPDTEGSYAARRAAALQAYYEWMPIRDPALGGRREEFWRSYRLGGLATLLTLESRHTGRSEQVDYSLFYARITSRAERDRFMDEVIGDPRRRMLSPAMEAFLEAELRRSVMAAEPWRLIGNASPLARMLVPDIAAAGLDPALAPAAEQPGAGPNLFWKGRWNLPFYTDTWDGYPAARERLYDIARRAGAADLVVLTGDSHSFWENRLFDGSGRPMGIELGTAGISSPGDFVETGWTGDAPAQLDRIFAAQLPEVVWTDNLHQGYVRAVLTAEAIDVAFIAVDTCLRPEYKLSTLRQSRFVRRSGQVVPVARG